MMGKQITLTIPDEVYHRAERIAQLKQQDVTTLLVEALAESAVLDEMASTNGDAMFAYEVDTAVEREKAAYLAMHPQLWQKYPGQHVAFHGGKLVDHDVDGIALSQRIYAGYRNEFVLIRQVEQEADRILHFRSPRFVEDA